MTLGVAYWVLGAGYRYMQPDRLVHRDVPVLYGKFSVLDAGGRCGFYVGRGVAGDLSGVPGANP